jgi:hypothetical protein
LNVLHCCSGTNVLAVRGPISDVARVSPVKPSAQPTQVRTLHLPPRKTPGQARCAWSRRAVLRHMGRSGRLGGRVWRSPWSGDYLPGAQFMDVARRGCGVVEQHALADGGLGRFTTLAHWRGDCSGGAGWLGCGTASGRCAAGVFRYLVPLKERLATSDSQHATKRAQRGYRDAVAVRRGPGGCVVPGGMTALA